jgi:hypothetical protein
MATHISIPGRDSKTRSTKKKRNWAEFGGESKFTNKQQGVSSIKPLKMKPVQRPSISKIKSTATYKTGTKDQNETSHTTLSDMPNEVLKVITSYLTFKDRMRIGRTNTRLRTLPMIPEFWETIKIRDTTLNRDLISTIIEMCTKRLMIPRCSIQGNHLEVYGLESFMIEHTPELEYISLAGYKGSDRLAATLVYMSKKLTVLDLAESRFALMSSIITRLPSSCSITAMDLSAFGNGANQEWTNGLPYETVKILVNR